MDRRFVVTTRSRLRGAHLFPRMYAATRRIARELEETPGAERFVSVIGGSREFWTISVWSSRHLMQEFMRSGAHGRIMWQFDDWLSSFWLMRWRPSRQERGSWDGLTLAPEKQVDPSGADAVPEHVRATILEDIPSLRDAFGPHGAPTYDAAPEVRRQRDLVGGAGGAVVRLGGSRLRGHQPVQRLRRLRDRLLRHDPDLLRSVVGVGRLGEGFLLGVWRSRTSAGHFLDSDRLDDLLERWPGEHWAAEWLPDNEFGHWDGLRLREAGEHGALGPQALSASPGPTGAGQ